MMAVVDRPARNRIVRTDPPRSLTNSEPTIFFPFQSPPFTSTCGTTRSIIAAGVSSLKITT
jgi:hypothetical protein